MLADIFRIDAATAENMNLTNGHVAKVLHIKITGLLVKNRLKLLPE